MLLPGFYGWLPAVTPDVWGFTHKVSFSTQSGPGSCSERPSRRASLSLTDLTDLETFLFTHKSLFPPSALSLPCTPLFHPTPASAEGFPLLGWPSSLLSIKAEAYFYFFLTNLRLPFLPPGRCLLCLPCQHHGYSLLRLSAS